MHHCDPLNLRCTFFSSGVPRSAATMLVANCPRPAPGRLLCSSQRGNITLRLFARGYTVVSGWRDPAISNSVQCRLVTLNAGSRAGLRAVLSFHSKVGRGDSSVVTFVNRAKHSQPRCHSCRFEEPQPQLALLWCLSPSSLTCPLLQGCRCTWCRLAQSGLRLAVVFVHH